MQVPDDTAIGPVTVTVTNGQLTSDPVTVNMSQYPPAFFAVGHSIAALHADNTLVGNAALAPGARPAKPGGTIALYGTGFGPTAPATPSGIIANSANPLADLSQLSLMISGVPTQVRFEPIACEQCSRWERITSLNSRDTLVLQHTDDDVAILCFISRLGRLLRLTLAHRARGYHSRQRHTALLKEDVGNGCRALLAQYLVQCGATGCGRVVNIQQTSFQLGGKCAGKSLKGNTTLEDNSHGSGTGQSTALITQQNATSVHISISPYADGKTGSTTRSHHVSTSGDVLQNDCGHHVDSDSLPSVSKEPFPQTSVEINATIDPQHPKRSQWLEDRECARRRNNHNQLECDEMLVMSYPCAVLPTLDSVRC